MNTILIEKGSVITLKPLQAGKNSAPHAFIRCCSTAIRNEGYRALVVVFMLELVMELVGKKNK